MHCPNAYCKHHDTNLTDHLELGTICDEHEDDLEDTLEYYRKIGGIGKLVPNPYTPLEEILGEIIYIDNLALYYIYM